LRDGAIDVPTAAISINLTHTEILESVAAPEEDAQVAAGVAVGQSGQAAPATDDADLKLDAEVEASLARGFDQFSLFRLRAGFAGCGEKSAPVFSGTVLRRGVVLSTRSTVDQGHQP
jgi:hypothetical protein